MVAHFDGQVSRILRYGNFEMLFINFDINVFAGIVIGLEPLSVNFSTGLTGIEIYRFTGKRISGKIRGSTSDAFPPS